MLPEAIINYFKAEKTESVIFIFTGLVTIGFASYCWLMLKSSLFKGMIFPFLIIGTIQLIVGCTVYFRTSSQVQELSIQFSESNTDFQNQETERMTSVMQSFTWIKFAEAFFIITGLLIVLAFAKKDWWLGFGIALLLQGTISIVLDLFAEKRGAEYLDQLGKIS